MLILSRRIGESIVIDGRIVVKIMRLDGEVVKLGIEAPREVPVHRQEVYDEIQRSNVEALTEAHAQLPHWTAQPTSSAPAKTKPVRAPEADPVVPSAII